VLGTITLFTGAIQALNQDQTKRLLAYSSISQAGYIVFGLGACLLLLPAREASLLALAPAAFYGALFHTVNHGLFKSLLFLNAGAVLHATGTQDLNKLGGLLRFMPWTGITALVGAFAIAGVPLLNGYVSKWSIFVAAIQGGVVVRWLPVCALVAILTSGITLALVIKFFGLTFLARASRGVTEHARHGRLEPSGPMQAAQVVLASMCVVFGLFPMLPLGLIGRAMQASRQGLGELLADAAPVATAWSAVSEFGGLALFAPLTLALVVALLFLLARWLGGLGGAARRVATPWLCGYAQDATQHRQQAGGLFGEFKRYFRWVGGRPRPETRRPDIV
jgi:formate hydrogenlyase subunit 3/multisubunit Na+/H+ antiporter MnhD subunit